jgi:GT2 family glycosyltransferase
MSYDVSICIVTWKVKDLVLECIRSIHENTKIASYEIIVVDNNSGDGTCDVLRKKTPSVKVLENSENKGFSRANNQAIKEASGTYILFLNPDTKLITNAIDKMAGFLDDNRDFGAVGCKLIYPDGRIQYDCARTFPTPLRQLSYLLMLNLIFPKYTTFSTVELEYWDHMDSRDVDCLSGACLMTRKEIIHELNGFDENLFMYGDEVDLCYRIKKLGWKAYYLSSEEIIHYGGASTKKRGTDFTSTIMRYEANYYFMRKHHSYSKARMYKYLTGVGCLIRMLGMIVMIPISRIRFMPDLEISGDTLKKYYSLLSWSLGLIRCAD